MAELTVEVKATELPIVQEMIKELTYLRYFYQKAERAMGPASDDIYDWIKESFEGEIPEGY